MDDNDLRHRVKELRDKGRTPKQIARALSVSPAEVARLVRAVAAESAAEAPEPGVVHCLVNSGWSVGLAVEGEHAWPDPGSEEKTGPGGLATVLVARRHRRDKLSVCTYLVDTYFLGVKNTIGPRIMDEEDFTAFVLHCYSAYDADPVQIPIDLAQHLVFGAVEFARELGFDPYYEFSQVRGHLGEMSGPSAIRFGYEGKPMYIQGPYDDPQRIMRGLNRSAGRGNFHFTAAADQL